jgi:hypothetical protein
MKLVVRASVLSLVFAGFAASAFTPKATAFTAAFAPANHSMVVSNAMPVPSCNPGAGEGCGMP